MEAKNRNEEKKHRKALLALWRKKPYPRRMPSHNAARLATSVRNAMKYRNGSAEMRSPMTKVSHVRIGAALINANSSSSFLSTEFLLNNKPLKFQLDCGSEAIVVDEVAHKQIGGPAIQKCSEQGRIFDGSLIRCFLCWLHLEYCLHRMSRNFSLNIEIKHRIFNIVSKPVYFVVLASVHDTCRQCNHAFVRLPRLQF